MSFPQRIRVVDDNGYATREFINYTKDILDAAAMVVALRRRGINLEGLFTSKVRIGESVHLWDGAQLDVTATKGFTYIPTCAGIPTGIPSELPAGTVPMVYDATNHDLYVYVGGAWVAV